MMRWNRPIASEPILLDMYTLKEIEIEFMSRDVAIRIIEFKIKSLYFFIGKYHLIMLYEGFWPIRSG